MTEAAPPDDGGPPDERRWPPAVALRLPFRRRKLMVDPSQAITAGTVGMATLGSIAGVWWFWLHGVTWFDVALLVFMFWLAGIGITLGYHRLFAHVAFEAKPWLRAVLGILGAVGLQGPIKAWTSVHRKHHRYSDRAGDPHSPLPSGPGRAAALRGFLHGHVGWMMTGGYTVYVGYIRDLWRDPVVACVDRWHPLWAVGGWMVPGFIGMAWYGTWDGYWAGFFAGGPIRALVGLNVTWSVNSLAHLIGRRAFPTADDSRNSAAVNGMALIGEGLHNHHHAFPWSARFALFPGEIDTGYWVLRVFERLGWAWNVRLPSERLIGARAASLGRPALALATRRRPAR